MSGSALRPYAPVEIVPGARAGGDDGQELLDQAVGDIGTTIFHPVGTCRWAVCCVCSRQSPSFRMGPAGDSLGVVDGMCVRSFLHYVFVTI